MLGAYLDFCASRAKLTLAGKEDEHAADDPRGGDGGDKSDGWVMILSTKVKLCQLHRLTRPPNSCGEPRRLAA